MRFKSFVVVLLFLVPLSAQTGSLNIGIGAIAADLESTGLDLMVDSPLDLGDDIPGDGFCATAVATCTLRAAVEETNAYPGADSITLPADTYVLSSSLTVMDDLSVFGEDKDTTIIDANGADVALLSPGADVTIESVTVLGGTSAGIETLDGDFFLISSRVRDNSGDGVRCSGFTGAKLTIVDGEVSENGGDGVSATDCWARILGSSITHNEGRGVLGAEGAGAVSVDLEDSYVADNLEGGLILLGLGSFNLLSTTVANNLADDGAGFYSDGCGRLVAVNSTFSGNRATGDGGGIYHPPVYCGSTSSLINTTITENVADSDADGFGDGGGIFSEDVAGFGELLNIQGTLLAENTDLSGQAPDCGGTEPLDSEGFNLIGDTTGCSIVGDDSSNITDLDPELGPLADNGGMTPTHRPLVLSPAIDSIPSGDCSVDIDQRGVIRPQLSGCEIGSVEVGLFCLGFEPPLAGGPVTVTRNRVLPFRAQLFDGDGFRVTDLDLTAPPVLQVWYEYGTPDAEDVSAQARPAGKKTTGNQFFFRGNKSWRYPLMGKSYSTPGAYTAFMISGDESEYFVEPSCSAQFVIE